MLIVMVCGLAAEDGTPPLLAPTIAGLVGAQAQLQATCSVAQFPVSSGLTDALVVRRTIAADWQRRLDSGAVRVDDPALGRFTGELKTLTELLQEMELLAREGRDSAQRYPHCLEQPAFMRFRALIGETLAKRMQEVVAGRAKDNEAMATWWRLQVAYRELLQVIEAQAIADEDYALLLRDDRWLLEYREYLLLARATLERAIAMPDDRRTTSEQEVLSAYTHLLGRRVFMLRRVKDSSLPAEHPALATFRRTGEVEVAALGRMVEEVRQPERGDEEHSRQRERIHREVESAQRFTGLAYEWLDSEESWRDTIDGIEEQLVEAPPGLAAEVRALVIATTAVLSESQVAFAAALAARDQLASLAAKHAHERARQRTDQRFATLSEDIAIAGHEEEWRVHAKDPAMAEKLKEWDMRRAAVLTARRAADAAEDAALAAAQEYERAELARERADEQAMDLRSAAERDDLWDLINALDEMAELRAGVQQ